MILRGALVLIGLVLLSRGAEGLFAAPVLALWPFSRPRNGAMSASGAAPLAMPRLMLVNLAPVDTVDDIELAPPLGSQAEVRAQIGAALRGIAFDEQGRGTYYVRDGSIDVELGTSDPIYTAIIAVRGSGAPAVARLLEQSGWRAYAPRTGAFVSMPELRGPRR